MTSCSAALQHTLEVCKSNDFIDNWDYRRYGPQLPSGLGRRLKDAAKSTLAAVGMYRNDSASQLMANMGNLEWLYERLVDEESKEILIKLLAYRMLGHRKVKLPLNDHNYWGKLAQLEERAAEAASEEDRNKLGLSKLNLADEGYPIELFVRPMGAFTQFLIEQYRCQLLDRAVEVAPGDVVIDAGGCYGDTALYFAHKAGGAGRVFSFEFMPDNVKVFGRNLALNPELAARIEIVRNPLWSVSGEKLFVEGTGSGAHITTMPKDPAATQVETLCIDDLIQRQQVAHVDFIKMDIEGAELEALKGAEATIRRNRPKLAICVYHHLQDFWEIPQWLDSLRLGYRFYLRHFTIHAEETVLFAEAIV